MKTFRASHSLNIHININVKVIYDDNHSCLYFTPVGQRWVNALPQMWPNVTRAEPFRLLRPRTKDGGEQTTTFTQESLHANSQTHIAQAYLSITLIQTIDWVFLHRFLRMLIMTTKNNNPKLFMQMLWETWQTADVKNFGVKIMKLNVKRGSERSERISICNSVSLRFLEMWLWRGEEFYLRGIKPCSPMKVNRLFRGDTFLQKCRWILPDYMVFVVVSQNMELCSFYNCLVRVSQVIRPT